MARLYNFFVVKNYWILLFFIVLVSYGQILKMGVWKDDNAIFFKLQHIEEPAGFFGRGVLGVGPYKFSATPYYPLYLIFGENSFLPYYVLIFVSYYIAALSVWRLFSKLGTETLGKISSFLFASGYIASEGFYWISNAMFSSLAVISTSLILMFYFLYLTKRKLFYFILSVFFFWLAIYFYPLRFYQVAMVIGVFELLFGLAKRGIRSLPYTILRFSPFITIYYLFFLRDVDSRASLVKVFVVSIVQGKIENFYSFFSGISSVVFPNKYLDILWNHKLFSLNSFGEKGIIALLGVIIFLLLCLLFFFVDRRLRRFYLFCLVWLSINLAIYSVYDPNAFFGTTHRYLTNSFLSLTGILGIIFVGVRGKNAYTKKLICSLVIIWGIGNIYNSYNYLKGINRERSIPVANFYRQLKSYLPKVGKGDVIYFDVNGNAASYFANAFSVSSMPETTAIAWRYHVDRYDFDMFTDFSELAAFLAKDTAINHLHTYYYDKDGLVDTTEKTRELLTNGSGYFNNRQIGEMAPLTNMLLEFGGRATLDTKKIEQLYPSPTSSIQNNDTDHIKRLIAYLGARDTYYQKVHVKSSSEWKYQELENVIDNNLGTSWRGHRIWWHDHKNEKLTIDLGETREVSRFVWVNFQKSTSPTAYSISVSLDNIHWQKVVDKTSGPAKKDGERVEEIFPSVKTRFLLFDITQTSTDDSPAISEVEVIDSQYSNVNVGEALNFVQNPLAKIHTADEAGKVLELVAPWLNLNVNVKTDKGASLVSVPLGAKLNERRSFSVYLPAGGTKLLGVDIGVANVPLFLEVSQLKIKNASLNEMIDSGFIKRFSRN